MTVIFEADKTKGKTVKVICTSCKIETNHKTLTSIQESGQDPWDEYTTFCWDTDYEIIQCLGCETISFRSHSINSEHDDYDGRSIPTTHVYPQRSKDTLSAKNFMNLPFNLRRIYRETIDSYNYGNNTLCGAGVRALVEGLCQENGIVEGNVEINRNDGSTTTRRMTNLQGKINGLAENGKLTIQNAEILHEHRFLGNEAIHELSVPSKEDLKLAIEIIDNVFEMLYEIPSKGQQLRNKRLNQ